MEVVGGQPGWLSMPPSTSDQIRQIAQATGTREGEIDHVLRHAELGDDQDRNVPGHGLQRSSRRDGRQSPSGGQRIMH
jgi:hypothetical protein